jgi:quinol monooxygenase YgiN
MNRVIAIQKGEAIVISILRRGFCKIRATPLFESRFQHVSRLALLFAIVMIGSTQAQAGGGAIYGVTSIDLAPNATGKGIALLKQYRDAVLKQPGSQEADLLQEVGWPNRFIIYEGWKDQAAYDANGKAAHTVEFCDRVKAISNAPCDRRDYFVYSVEPPRPTTGANTIYMMLSLDVKPPKHDSIVPAVVRAAEFARKNRKNLRYDVVGSVKPPRNYITVFSAWQGRKAFDDYETSSYARSFRDAAGDGLGSPFNDHLYVLIK